MKVCSIADLLLLRDRNPRVGEMWRNWVILRHEMHLRLLRCLGAERHLYRCGGLLFALVRVEATIDHSTSPMATGVLNESLTRRGPRVDIRFI
jgi:hypothetical protein